MCGVCFCRFTLLAILPLFHTFLSALLPFPIFLRDRVRAFLCCRARVVLCCRARVGALVGVHVSACSFRCVRVCVICSQLDLVVGRRCVCHCHGVRGRVSCLVHARMSSCLLLCVCRCRAC